MTYLVRYGVMGIVLAGAVGFFFWRNWDKPLPLEIKLRPAPEFGLKDYEGREVKLSDFRGKSVLVNAWAGWCEFCVKELADFARIQEEFGDKVVVVAIDRGESLERAKVFSDQHGVTGKIILLLDPGDSFYQSIGGFSMPETIFVDKDGLIRDHKRGPMKLEEMRRKTQQAFNL